MIKGIFNLHITEIRKRILFVPIILLLSGVFMFFSCESPLDIVKSTGRLETQPEIQIESTTENARGMYSYTDVQQIELARLWNRTIYLDVTVNYVRVGSGPYSTAYITGARLKLYSISHWIFTEMIGYFAINTKTYRVTSPSTVDNTFLDIYDSPGTIEARETSHDIFSGDISNTQDIFELKFDYSNNGYYRTSPCICPDYEMVGTKYYYFNVSTFQKILREE